MVSGGMFVVDHQFGFSMVGCHPPDAKVDKVLLAPPWDKQFTVEGDLQESTEATRNG